MTRQRRTQPEATVATTKVRQVGKVETVSVRFLTSVGGTDVSYVPGQVVEMSTEDADRWCDGERAERA